MLKLGLQTYTVREEMDNDLIKTLRKIRQIGYDGVELCSFYGHSGEELRQIVEAEELELISVSFQIQDVIHDCKREMRQIAQTGAPYAVIPYMPPEKRYGQPEWEQTLADIRTISKECAKNGLQLLYHNHDFEFHKQDGIYDYDRLLQAFQPGELMAELDVCWLSVSGLSPVKQLRKLSRRVPLVHVKDYEGRPDFDTFHFCAVGNGVIEFSSVIKAAHMAGAEWIIVEQDQPEDGKTPFECVQMSYDYLKKTAF